MIVYRLCKQEYVNDLSGHGAELNGGRWNSKGNPALYTAGTRALAVLEVAVHVPFGIIPTEYYMNTIEIPEKSGITQIEISRLQGDWNRNPISRSTQYIGDDFLNSKERLILQAPSVSVSGDFNYIINPLHPNFKLVKVLFSEPFQFDPRLFNR